MKTTLLVSMLALCALSGNLSAAPSSAMKTERPADPVAVAGLPATPPQAGVTEAESVADTHLRLQYSLHRASRSLYNPAAGLLMAGVPAEADTLGHVTQ
mgnify:CR=1 FL=1|jgi:hypothetical protein